jgi:hypothetical protein
MKPTTKLKDLKEGQLFMFKNGNKIYAFKYLKNGIAAYWNRGKKHYTTIADKEVIKVKLSQ